MKYPAVAVKVMLIVVEKRLSPVKEYVVPCKVQTDPVRDPVQVDVGVKSVGTTTVIFSKVGSGALIVKGAVTLIANVEEASKTSELVGVYVVVRVAVVIAALAVPSST